MNTTIQNSKKNTVALDFSELQEFLTKEIGTDDFATVMEDAHEMLLDRLLESSEFVGGNHIYHIMWHFRQFVKIAKRIKPIAES